MLQDDEGIQHVGDKVVGNDVVSYFKHVFASSHPYLILEALDQFEARVIEDMNVKLRADYTEEEVRCP